MPAFITGQIYDVIFPLLAHAQLSIREHAIKTFSSFLARSEFQVRFSFCSRRMVVWKWGGGGCSPQEKQCSHQDGGVAQKLAALLWGGRFSRETVFRS